MYCYFLALLLENRYNILWIKGGAYLVENGCAVLQ